MPSASSPPSTVVTVPLPPVTAFDIPYLGVPFQLDRSMTVQTSADGSPMVVTTTDCYFTQAMTTLTAVQTTGTPKAGRASGLTYKINGGQINPAFGGNYPPGAAAGRGGGQGWCEWLAWFNDGGGNSRQNPYYDELDLNPSRRGPMFVAAGSAFTYIQSVFEAFGDHASQRTIGRYVPLTFIPTALPAGSFRPNAVGVTKTNLGLKLSDINYTVLRNETTPANARTLTDVISAINNGERMRPFWKSEGGEKTRAIETMVPGQATYAAQYMQRQALRLAALHWTATNAEKQPLAVQVVQNAIDIYGAWVNGQSYAYGAGQWGTPWLDLLYAAALTGKTEFLDCLAAIRSNTLSSFLSPIPPILVGQRGPWAVDNNSGAGNRMETYAPEDTWGYVGLPGYTRDALNSQLIAPYQMVNAEGITFEIAAASLVQGLPAHSGGSAGQTGLAWMKLAGFTGGIEAADDFSVFGPREYFVNNNQLLSAEKTLYAAMRNSRTPAKTTKRPLQARPYSGVTVKYHATAITNGVRWDAFGTNLGRNTVSDRQLMLTLDGRDGRRFTGLSSTTQDLTTGVMIGMPHLYKVRFADSAGELGRWSPTSPDDGASTGLFPAITPLGTAGTGTAVNSVIPVICFRPTPHDHHERYEPVQTPLPINTQTLYGSVGYWFGGENPASFNVKWQENSGSPADIAGTSENVTVAGLPGRAWGRLDPETKRNNTVRFAVQAVGPTGTLSAWAYSAWLTIPARTEKTSFYTTDRNAPLKNMTHRIDPATGGAVLTFDGTISPNAIHGITISPATVAANRFISLDRDVVLGDLSDVPEGEMLIPILRTGTNSALSVEARCRMSGTTTANMNGFGIEFAGLATTYKLNIVRYTAGARSVITDIDRAYPAGNDTGLSSDWPLYLRMNWRLVSTELQLRGKLIPFPQRPKYVWSEPSWMVTNTFTGAPGVSGRLGLGINLSPANAAPVKIEGIGLSIDPTVDAPFLPPIPPYTYS